jgi:hypothetical protein
MSWSKFEWIKELQEKPKYAEIVNKLHNEVIVKSCRIRERGYAITEAKTE